MPSRNTAPSASRQNRAARMAARYAQHVERQPERRAEPEPEHELRKLTEQDKRMTLEALNREGE